MESFIYAQVCSVKRESKKESSGKGTKRRRDIEGLGLLAERLRVIRVQKNITQEDLANMSGIALSQIGRIERASINPTVSTIFTLCRTLEIEVAELFTFKLENNVIN